MTLRAYPNWIQAYVQHMRFSESPTKFHFWTGVSTVAGALRRRVWNNQRIFQWTPNFFIIFVAPPGIAAKSTSMRQGMELLGKIKGVNFGPQSLTWQALMNALQEVQESVPIKGQEKNEVMACLTVATSELGTFLQPENKEFMDFLINMWDGQRESFSRRTLGAGEMKVVNPWINLIGCTTPAWIKDRLPSIMLGGGLVSRILFVYADKKQQYVAYPAYETTGPEYEWEEKHLLIDLNQIAQLQGEFKIHPDAITWGQAWYDELQENPPQHLNNDRFQGYLSRKWTHMHKLAMILSAASKNELEITLENLQEAEAQITSLEADMLHVFNAIGVAPQAKVSSEVLSIIKKHGTITYKQLYQMCYNTLAAKDFKDSVSSAIEAGLVSKAALPNNDWNLTFIGKK